MTHKLKLVEPYERLGLRELSASAERVEFEIPLSGNRNDKGTAFGGSYYSAMILAGWRLCEETASELGLSGDIVVKDSHVDFLRPGTSDSTAVATHLKAPAGTRHGNLAFDVTATTLDAEGTLCARMHASFRLLAASRPASESQGPETV